MRKVVLCLPVLYLLSSALATTSSILSFLGVDPPRFVEEKLIATGSLGLPDKLGMISAWGDFNSDQLLDLVYLAADQRSLSIYTWSRLEFKWIELINSRIKTPSDFIIQNVVPGDYDYDGRLDLLVMGSANPEGSWWNKGDDNVLQMKLYLQQSDGSFSTAYAVNDSTTPQPIPFDATGDMRNDLLGFSLESTTLKLWKNVWESSNRTAIFNLTDAPFQDVTALDCKFPSPHFNAFIDLDGDCLADLFLTCQNGKSADDLSYQIWVNDKSGGFKLSRKGDLPPQTRSVGFADMDRDGTMDLVVTACPSADDCQLYIAYNVQVPLCSTSQPSSTPCRDPEALCVADPNFRFNFSLLPDNADLTTISISSLLPHSTLITSSSAFRGNLPVAPSIGDYNIDGYPDLLLLTSTAGGQHVNLLESRPCDITSCSEKEVAKERRAFRVVTNGAEALTVIDDAESAHWMDMDDDGSLDIVVQRTGKGGASRAVTFIKNNYFHDAFFLKALVLNGACQGWCEPSQPDESPYRPYGVSYSGASYKFTVLDPSGERKATQVGQLSQSSYVSLQTPYSYFGLGRTNNYVENLFVGSTRHQPQHFINVEGLIPNSQVIIDPYQPDGRTDPGTWTRTLYLQPGDWIPWVTLVLSAAIGLLGGFVLILHLNEKRQDEVERRARLILLNFSAL